MPATDQTETPGQRVMRQHYQGRIAERMIQVGGMAEGRSVLRRGSRKMQDGTLGQPGDPTEEDPMNIRVGDEVHHHHEPIESKPAAPGASGTLPKLALAAALLASGAGLGVGASWLLGMLNQDQQQPPAAEFVDTDTTMSIGIGGGEPTMEW